MKFATKKVSARHKLGSSEDLKGNPKIVIPEVPVPEYENFEEFVNAAGTPEAALDFVNEATGVAAAKVVREFVTESPVTGITEAQIIARAIEYGKSFTPSTKTTNKEKGSILDQILARVRTEGAQAVQEDLLALAQRMS